MMLEGNPFVRHPLSGGLLEEKEKMTMAKQTMARDARGNYRRDVGWERVGDEWRQHRFYVGKDRVQAALRVARLDQTWDCICKAWQRDHDTPRPQWDTETLPMALAVARGEEEIALDVPQEVSEPADAILWLSQMRKDFPHLRLVPADAAVQAQGEAYWESRQKELEQAIEEVTLRRASPAASAMLS
jgi:hypothetical protein